MTPEALASLNENQRAAVLWDAGPLLVLAGPGSGKTRVLTMRVARLLNESPAEHFRVLGITFTNKAAAEMRERLHGHLAEDGNRALLTTFHSFAAELLRRHGSHVGLSPEFAILAQHADRVAALGDAIRESGRSLDDYSAERLIPTVDSLLDRGVQPDAAEAHLRHLPDGRAFAEIYRAYLSHLRTANQLDFGAMLVVVISLLTLRPAIAKQVMRVYKFVCVDEFQDTNAAQMAFLTCLVPQALPNLFVVADDDQLIYQWNGADPQRLRDLRQRYSMSVVQLPQNYRCPPEVISLANALIKHNEDRDQEKEELTTSRAPSVGEVVSVLRARNEDEERALVAAAISARPPDAWPQCVVLARTRKIAEGHVAALVAAGVPAHVATRKSEFASPPIQVLHAALRLANARSDREHVRRLCRAFFSVEGINLRPEDVVGDAPAHGGDFLRSWRETAIRRELHPATRAFLEQSVAALVERNAFETFADGVLEWAEALTRAGATVPEGAFDEFADESASWTRLFAEIGSEHGRSELTLNTLLHGLDLRSKEPPPPPGAVRCFTIHTAKGMEFRHVYVVGLAEDVLPSWSAVKKGDASDEMREERRNCFVAITRAQDTLTLSFAERYNGYSKNPSRFLREMGLAVR